MAIANRAQVNEETIRNVYLSGKRVPSSSAADVIPKGYRQATLKEVILGHLDDKDLFRFLLSKIAIGPVWVADRDIEGSEFNKISHDGRPLGVSRKEYDGIEPIKRVRLYPGGGQVAVWSTSYPRKHRGFNVVAEERFPELGLNPCAKVAYVKLSKAEMLAPERRK